MLREHKIGIFCLMLINMQDGFDLLSIAFAASSISKQWGLSQSSLGLVFSASLMGMLIGATFMSPYADRIGRKPMIIMGLLLSGIGMICAGMSVDVKWLFAGRLITGIGVGAIIASINTLAAEYATDKNRSTMIALLQLGFPIGAFASGYLCLWILDIATWRYIFFLGAALSFIFIPVVFMLPASNEYSRIENYKQGRPGLFKLQEVLTVKYKYRTFLICLSFLLLLMTLYFLLSWVPKLFVDLGYSDSEGNRAGRLINLIGMVGIIAIGFLALKFNMAKLSATFLVALPVLVTFYIYLFTVCFHLNLTRRDVRVFYAWCYDWLVLNSAYAFSTAVEGDGYWCCHRREPHWRCSGASISGVLTAMGSRTSKAIFDFWIASSYRSFVYL